jgi:hypothetical protein
MSRMSLYILVNLLFVATVVVGFAIHRAGVHPVYVILLFMICSTPIIEARAVNGPYALLVLWSLDFFLMYGALDFRNLIFGMEGGPIQSDGLFTTAELLILLGGLLVQVAYRMACRPAPKVRSSAPPKDWPELTLVVVGIGLWVVSSGLCWDFSVNLVATNTAAGTSAALESLGGAKVGIFMIARMAQPLSILILAYVQCRYRRPYMTPIVLGVVIFQLIFGFVIDFKTEALIGGVLVVLTNLLVNARVPKGWVALMLVVVAVGFPVLQANRVVRDERAVNSTKASENLALIFEKVLQAKDRANTGRERAQTALERLTTKSSVELLVRGTGVISPFQHGYTLMPMITTFIPRLLWPNKPSIPTGQILNKEFHVSAGTDTYISPSHLGELYWNFGWGGVIVGMSLIGFLLGSFGRKFNLAEAATVTRVLVVVVTVRQLILASEGEFATQYVVWMRSLLGIGLLHWALARISWVSRVDDKVGPAVASADAPKAASPRFFPNLLR